MGSACETVLSGGFRYYPHGLPERFPGCGVDAIGIEGYAGMPLGIATSMFAAEG